jgi:hypothetical protein
MSENHQTADVLPLYSQPDSATIQANHTHTEIKSKTGKLTTEVADADRR